MCSDERPRGGMPSRPSQLSLNAKYSLRSSESDDYTATVRRRVGGRRDMSWIRGRFRPRRGTYRCRIRRRRRPVR